MEKQLLNRKIYRKAKKMDRQEMEEFVRGYYLQGYKRGFQEGSSAGQQADTQIELIQFLQNIDVKGIGEKTKEKIVKAYRERIKANE